MTSPLEQKKIKIAGPSMVTANRTWDGVVIYRTDQQSWSADLSDAAIVRTSDEARALLTEAVADDVGAIGAYIAPVEVRDGGKVEPEEVRQVGPVVLYGAAEQGLGQEQQRHDGEEPDGRPLCTRQRNFARLAE